MSKFNYCKKLFISFNANPNITRVTYLLLIKMSLILPYFLKNLSMSFSLVLGGIPPKYTLVDILIVYLACQLKLKDNF